MPATENSTYGRHYSRPPPDLVDEEEEWEIEAVLDHRYLKKRSGVVLEFLIRWKGYGPSDDTWEPEDNLTNAEEDLKVYKRAHGLS